MIALNVVTYNEAHRIVGCLDSAAQLCDEFVVVDQGSIDGTADLAREWGATVVEDLRWGYCEISRPVAANHTLAPWILVLDADERLFPEVIPTLREAVERGQNCFLGYRHYVDGLRRHADSEHYRLRLFKCGTVTIGTTPHSRIEGEGREVPRAVLHEKSLAEHEADVARYRVIA